MSARPATTSSTRIASADEVLMFVASASGVDVADIKGASRTKSRTCARGVAAYVLREHCHMSYTEIATLLSRDHSTVIRVIDYVRTRLDDDHVRTIYDRVMQSIGSATRW